MDNIVEKKGGRPAGSKNNMKLTTVGSGPPRHPAYACRIQRTHTT